MYNVSNVNVLLYQDHAHEILLNLANAQLLIYLISWESFLQTPSLRTPWGVCEAHFLQAYKPCVI